MPPTLQWTTPPKATADNVLLVRRELEVDEEVLGVVVGDAQKVRWDIELLLERAADGQRTGGMRRGAHRRDDHGMLE